MHELRDEIVDTCVLCGVAVDAEDGTVRVGEKAASTINNASKERGSSIHVQAGQLVHSHCRHKHTNRKDIASAVKRKAEESVLPSPSLRPKKPAFQYATHCLYCTVKAVDRDGFPFDDVFRISTWNCQNAILRSCVERGDKWADDVKSRVEFARDLPAADSIYHKVCSGNFRTGRRLPAKYDLDYKANVESRSGRKVDASREEAFQIVVAQFIEEEEEFTTIAHLQTRMENICQDSYSIPYLKKKLKNHFGDSLVISDIEKYSNVVILKKTASNILREFYEDQKPDDSEATKKMSLLKAAAALIKSDIISIEESRSEYPSISGIGDTQQNLNYIPFSLRMFLAECFKGRTSDNDLKIAAIGQCIMQQVRPRSIMAPMQFALAMHIHWAYGSSELIDDLSSRGFCVSYDEVKLFKACAAHQNRDQLEHLSNSFCHFIADNVDHNTVTIAGKDTYHGMGLMCAATPSVATTGAVIRNSEYFKTKPTSTAVTRCRRLGKVGDMLNYKAISTIVHDDIREHLDTLWKISFPYRHKRPAWSGFMQMTTRGCHLGKASFQFLPMIDLEPTNMSCIFTTLMFVNDQCTKYNISPVITFDQPLWLKARHIISHETQLQHIVLILGPFHTLMSFLGTMGHIMKDSGLRTLLELVYGPNTVNHILAGKAYERAVRGHFLVDAALNALIVKKASVHEGTKNALDRVLEKFDRVLQSTETEMEAQDEDIVTVEDRLSDVKDQLQQSPNGKLWVQYMKMMDILRSALRGQRTSQPTLYFRALQRMLPFFAASGHNNYTKSAHLFLQDMVDLKKTNEKLHDQLIESGLLFIRRSDRFWAGLAPDLVIEQVLMKSIKSSGGLTHGRGMDETQRTRWLQSMPIFAQISEEMKCVQEKSGNERNKELTESRIRRDQKDTTKIFQHLEQHSPFTEDTYLYNIISGLCAPKSNAHLANDIGNNIIKMMEGQSAANYTFKKKHQIKTMGQKIVSDGVEMQVDPQALFQRLLVIATNAEISLSVTMRYELSVYPPSLFTSNGLPRGANKPQLTDAIAKCTSSQTEAIPKAECSVFDGGSLLQRIQWTTGETYEDIASKYVALVKQNNYPIVVFDGYRNSASTKCVTHQKRARGLVVTPDVHLAPTQVFTFGSKQSFLANKTNKQRFIDFLSETLKEHGVSTKHAEGDADLLIVQEAVNMASRKVTHVIAEDTDIFVLLCHHIKPDSLPLFMVSQKLNVKHPIWNIGEMRLQLGEECCRCLPFMHALCGCDTTSRLNNIGKGVVLKKQSVLFECAVPFLSVTSTHEEIKNAGERALIQLYSSSSDCASLDELRKKKFQGKVIKSLRSVDVKDLPPTSDSAKYHSFRVYYQTQVWLGNRDVKPDDWGWKRDGSNLIPCTMDNSPAPDALLKVIRCKCKGLCDTQHCSCKKHGLYCTDFCEMCQATNCVNTLIDEDTE